VDRRATCWDAVREEKYIVGNDIEKYLVAWKDPASKGVRFVSFGSYNKIWKKVALFLF
jgi:hypothetical protein